MEDETLERYSVLRSIAAIDRCDVALLLIDAQTGVTEQDTKIAGLILSAGKAVLVAVNKWDAVEKDTNTMEQFRKKILSDLKFMSYAPVLFLSALTGQRVNTVLAAVKAAYEQYSRRIPTACSTRLWRMRRPASSHRSPAAAASRSTMPRSRARARRRLCFSSTARS